MDCDRCGKRLKSKEFVNVQWHYESDLCKRKFTAAVNQHQMQKSEPPADKRQRLLCMSAASAACSTTTGIPVGVALHESIAIACVPSVSDQNQLLPKPFCLGYLPDVPAPFVHNWAFAAHYVWSYHFLDHMESMHPGQKLTEEEVRKYAIRKDEYLGVLGKKYRAMEQEKRLKIYLTRLKDDAASVTNPSRTLLEQSSCRLMFNVVIRIYVFIVISVLIVVTRE